MDIDAAMSCGAEAGQSYKYSREYIARLKEAVDIVAIVAEHVDLKQASADGNQWKGLCPFHADHAPSFYVYANTHSYHCFGCQESGDVFTFLVKQKGLSFPQAVRTVRRITGIDPPDPKQAIIDSFAELSSLARERVEEGYTPDELLLQLSKWLGRFLKDHWQADWIYERTNLIFEAADIAYGEGDHERLQRIVDRIPDELIKLSRRMNEDEQAAKDAATQG